MESVFRVRAIWPKGALSLEDPYTGEAGGTPAAIAGTSLYS